MDLHDLTPGYALDALDADEHALYEEHLAGCDRCREELQGFWQVSGALAHAAGGPAPPTSLRARILEQARDERPNVIPLRRRFAVPVLSSAAAVAAVAAIAFGVWATSLSNELDELRNQAGSERQAIAVLADPNHRAVPLSGADGRLVVSTTGNAALVLSGLDPAPVGKVYEIWVIEAGTPKPAGLFAGANTRTVLALSRPVPDDAVVAVTLERAGGVDAPTGTPLFTSASA